MALYDTYTKTPFDKNLRAQRRSKQNARGARESFASFVIALPPLFSSQLGLRASLHRSVSVPSVPARPPRPSFPLGLRAFPHRSAFSPSVLARLRRYSTHAVLRFVSFVSRCVPHYFSTIHATLKARLCLSEKMFRISFSLYILAGTKRLTEVVCG